MCEPTHKGPLTFSYRDLLSDDPSYKMEVKMNPDGGLYVPGLSFVEVSTVDDVNEVKWKNLFLIFW